MSKIWCVDCFKSYARKSGWIEHFELKEVKATDSGKLVTNPCYGRKRKASANSLEEARTFKRLKPMNEVFKKKESGLENTPPSQTSQQELNNVDNTDGDSVPQANLAATLDTNQLRDIYHMVRNMETKIDSLVLNNSKLPENNKSVSVSNSNDKLIAPGTTFDKEILKIRSSTCHSVESILKNPLIKDIFEVKFNEDTEEEYLFCLICQKNATTYKTLDGIRIEGGSSYSSIDQTTGVKNKLDKWFSNFKKKVVTHLNSAVHTNAVIAELKYNEKVCKLKAEIHSSMRHLAYFTIHSNLPFEQFPTLLATVNKCGLNLGDINHTRNFVTSFLELVNEEIFQKTYQWFSDQQELTVTLDIGTVYGITLLAILVIGKEGTVKLINIAPITSKKGADVASVCYETLKMNGKIQDSELKEKVVGLTGDGAFAKLNKPFKNKITELLGKNVPIRWDILHLINRAHKDARGKTEFDKDNEDNTLDSDDATFTDPTVVDESSDNTEVCKLIDYIQSEAKKYRSGIKYTDLMLTTDGKFKRPKVWSNTRMVVYEFEMLERFLENKIYFDHPEKSLTLAKVYCLAMFALKIVLKCVQKTNISQQYVKSVIIEGHGKSAMKLASQVAVDVYNNNSISYLLEENLKDENHNVSITRKCFAKELHDYIMKKEDMFNKEIEEPRERITRHSVENEFTVEHAKSIVDKYIDALWDAIHKRLEYADLDDLSSCAFSEAPAESVFSVYARVTSNRECLTVGHAVSLVRVAMHGPSPSTDAAHKLAGAALVNFKSKLGERFCTQMWFKGKTSKTILNLQKKEWKW